MYLHCVSTPIFTILYKKIEDVFATTRVRRPFMIRVWDFVRLLNLPVCPSGSVLSDLSPGRPPRAGG